VWLLLARGYDFYNRRGFYYVNEDEKYSSCSIYKETYRTYVQSIQNTKLSAVLKTDIPLPGDIAELTLGKYARLLMSGNIKEYYDEDIESHKKIVEKFVKEKLDIYYVIHECDESFKLYTRNVNAGTLRNWTFFRSIDNVTLVSPPKKPRA
jgi:uncharacterized protein YaaR (DUF327 family)